MTTIEVDPGDPHNDQMLAQTSEDLTQHLEIVRHVLDQAEEKDAPLSAVVAVVATSMIENEKMPRERLASLLALALVQINANAVKDEEEELESLLKSLNE
ncbi:MAG TPA: hypothetical protein VIY48_11795 [Candidatus Paceibacterota bacterium]